MPEDSGQGGAPKGLGMPLDIARQQLRDDVHTQSIAKSLGMELDEYVELVLDYATHPEKEPMVEVLDDESLAAAGPDLPSPAQIMAWFKGVTEGTIELPVGPKAEVEHDDFTTRKDKVETLKEAAGLEVERRAPVVGAKAADPAPVGDVGAVLKQQLRARQAAARQAIEKGRTKKQPGEE